MSQRPQEEKKTVQKSEKKRRSPIERIVVWVLILGLAGLVWYEYLQKQAYQKDHDIVEKALSQSTPENPPRYDDIRGKLSKEPMITETNYGGAPAMLYAWKWNGLKEHKLEVIVSKSTGNLLMIKQPGE
jgi:hypothetical protein